LAQYDFCQSQVVECDAEIEAVLKELNHDKDHPPDDMPTQRHQRGKHEPTFDARTELYKMLGQDITQIHGMGPSKVLTLIGECGDDMTKWPTAKHFTSWLGLAPGNKISGGKLLSSRTRRITSRAATALRLAAISVGRTQTALGAFYRRLAARVGKAKAVTATARKLAIRFYNALRYGEAYSDPGVSYYEERYRQRVIKSLERRAAQMGFALAAVAPG
jgi:transposase